MRRLLSVLILSTAWVASSADNIVVVSSANGAPCEEVQIDISLSSTDAVAAVELRIPLNEYIQYLDGTATLNDERSNGHLLSAASVGNELRLFVYNLEGKTLKGEKGNLVSFKLKLGKNPEVWTLMPAVVLSNAEGKSLNVSTTNGQVTILAPQLTIETTTADFGHVPIRNSYTRMVSLKNSGTSMLTVNSISFSACEFSVEQQTFTIEAGKSKAAIVHYRPTKHGSISETMTITSDAANGAQETTLKADPYSVNELHVGTTSGVSDSEVTLTFSMNNMEPIAAGQWTIILPDELKYVEGSIKSEGTAEALTANATVSGNKLTCILYSTSNTIIEEGNGIIASIRLCLQGSSGTYSLTASNVVLSNARMENMVSATSSGNVKIKSPTINSSTTLSMGKTSVTETAEQTYDIRNKGQVELTITNISFLSEGFCIKECLPLTIAPSATKSITVCYIPKKEGSYSTTMNIYSNDPTNRLKAVSLTGEIYEPNALSMNGKWYENGEMYQLNVALENYTNIVAAQMDIHIPTDITKKDVTSGILPSIRMKDIMSQCIDMGNGVYRAVFYSINNTPITGHSGDIFSLSLQVDDVKTAQGKEIIIDNIVLSNVSGINYASSSQCSHKISDAPITAIDKITMPYSYQMYDLSGKQIKECKKGIFIIKGKKILK